MSGASHCQTDSNRTNTAFRCLLTIKSTIKCVNINNQQSRLFFFLRPFLEYYFFLILMRNGTLHYPNPNDIDKSLNDAAADKIRKYRADYNSNPLNAISFVPAITSTSDRLHSEFIRLLFLQDHRETDRFFAASGVQSVQSNLGSSYSHFRRAAFSSMMKSKCGNILPKSSLSHILTHHTHKLLDC